MALSLNDIWQLVYDAFCDTMTTRAYDFIFPTHETLKSLLRKQKLSYGTVMAPLENLEEYDFEEWHFTYSNEQIIHKIDNGLIFIHPKV